jgi:hypothetical protein
MGNLLLMNSEALRIHGFSEMEDMKKQVREYSDLFALKTPEGEDVPWCEMAHLSRDQRRKVY